MDSTKNSRMWVAVLVCLMVIVCTAAGKTIYVDDDGPADFNKIQAAIEDSNDGDIIVVAEGTYTGEGNRDIDFMGKAITVCSADPNDANIVAATIIDCEGLGCGIYFRSGEDAHSVLAGITIKNGRTDGGGGGIHCHQSSPTILNCTLSNNASGYLGGGMYISSANPTLTNCTFIDNWSRHEGGGLLNKGDPKLTNCMFIHNTADYSSGGGMYNAGSPTLLNCMFLGNTAKYSAAGGLASYTGNISLINCVFSGNSAAYEAGAIRGWNLSLTNCTIANNSAGTLGGGIYTSLKTQSSLNNCILWGNTDGTGQVETAQINITNADVAINYCCIQGWTGAGAGNISDNPIFIDPDGADNVVGTVDDDLRLQPGSPCADAGDNYAVPAWLAADADGDPRFADDPDAPDTGKGTPPIVDMGPYESPKQGILLSSDDLSVPEGATATFAVALALDPLETVELSVAHVSGDPDITIESGHLLIFDSSNYSVPQTVILAAAEDEDNYNSPALIVITGPGFRASGVTATEAENEPHPNVIFVDIKALGACNGFSWADAFTNLQDALRVAAERPEVQEIWVADGTYRPDLGPYIEYGDREAAFQLINGVTIKGGYRGFGAPSPDERDVERYKSILSGDLRVCDGKVADACDLLHMPTRSDNSYHVVSAVGTDTSAVLDGFTVTAGNADYPISWPEDHRSYGGGLYIEQRSHATILNCTFSNNSGQKGGGVFYDHSNSVLQNCSFIANAAHNCGGGIYDGWSSKATVTGCEFSANWAPFGGGIYIHGSETVLTHCTFSGNCANEGGGIRTDESYPIVKNCIFTGNWARYGGALHNFEHSYPMLTNCTFSGNSARYDPYDGIGGNGGGILNSNSRPTLTNCILWSNTPDQIYGDHSIVNYTCIQGWTECLGGTGNIGDNPLFVDPNNDYHLLPSSPCIDTGDPNYVAEPNETDLEGNPRIMDGDGDDVAVVDMGAYEAAPYVACCFGVNHLKIAQKGKNLDIKGTFKPIVPVDLAVDDVTFIIDDGQGNVLEVFIPAGSFKPDGKAETQRFKYYSPKKSRPEIKAKFDFGKCRFELEAKKITSADKLNGTTLGVALYVGNNVGEGVLEVEAKKKHLEYRRKRKMDCCRE